MARLGLAGVSLAEGGVRGAAAGAALTREQRSERDPNIALKRLPAEPESRRLFFLWGTRGGLTTLRALSPLDSAARERL